MRSSTVITLLGGASLAVASPIGNLFKKAIIWDIYTDIVYETVTASEAPAPAPTPIKQETTVIVEHTVTVGFPQAPAATSPPPPPPAPAPTTMVPKPKSSTVAPPVQAPVTSAAPPAAPVTSLAPIQEDPATSASVTNEVVAAVVDNAVSAPTDFISSSLFYHNQLRAIHGAGKLTWDATLAANAQVLANRCKFAHDGTIGGGGYGQNIDMVGMVPAPGANSQQLASLDAQTKAWDKASVIGDSTVNNWYKPEEPLFANTYHAYGAANPVETSAGQFLHFTQIVWKDTTKLGCAVAYCGTSMFSTSYSWYSVCNYASPGNYVGEYAKQVSRPVNTKIVVNAPFPS
ncbi:CAP domain-containing protein [Calycina marina]|uniref:CAP domain-containing protein n=1 Tax=Calycina marina TaxID=1763456 RepID=A0A9P7Z2A9_9HELO|nr:CAP domain-containing protein [Calycina marina]